MVTLWNEETKAEALSLASTLRAAGLRVDVYPDVDKIGKQFKYASTRRVPLVAVVGDDERVRGEVTVKDMRSGAQETVDRQQAAAHIKKMLDR
jgi:histidyl-tRNA synthetase